MNNISMSSPPFTLHYFTISNTHLAFFKHTAPLLQINNSVHTNCQSVHDHTIVLGLARETLPDCLDSIPGALLGFINQVAHLQVQPPVFGSKGLGCGLFWKKIVRNKIKRLINLKQFSLQLSNLVIWSSVRVLELLNVCVYSNTVFPKRKVVKVHWVHFSLITLVNLTISWFAIYAGLWHYPCFYPNAKGNQETSYH